MALARSILFTALMFVSIVPWCMVILVGRLAGSKAAYSLTNLWPRGMVWLCQQLCGLGYRVEGQELIPAENSIVMLKHSSAYETLVQQLIFPRQCWVLKRELIWTPFFGWALAALKPIAIHRGAGQRAVGQVLAQGKQRVADGLWVMVFPEGTRMPPGETRRYGISGTLLAQQTGRLLVPVAHNAGDFWPRRGWRKRRGTVTFRIGPPIDPAGRDPREVNADLQRWIENAVAELRSEGGATIPPLRYQDSPPPVRSAR